MCGIFALLNHQDYFPKNVIENEFNKGKNRGPEFSKLDYSYLKMVLGFHRLAINGLNNESNQPLVINDIVLICNGEIYNYKELYNSIDINPITESDCEVIIHLYIKYGIEQTLIMLDGVFSFVLFDNRTSYDLNNKIYIARDPYGIRPLYQILKKTNLINSTNQNFYGFASELKCLEELYNTNNEQYSITQFTPGTYSVFNLSDMVLSNWKPIELNKYYFIFNFSYIFTEKCFHFTNNFQSIEYIESKINIQLDNYKILQEKEIFKNIYDTISLFLRFAVYKRCLTTERPIACLLSGGLDSSLIAALVAEYYKKSNEELETYSIGLKDSEDLKYAKIVAEWICSKHTEIIVTEQEMFDAIPEVIYAIESYDTTTVRASIGNYLLGKYIAKNSEAKVIFNGDGSDELFGGYLYMNQCPDDIEFDKETRRLLKDIHLFDVLRSDKSISSNGLEPRTPFLDKTFANYVLSIPPYYRNHNNFNKIEKSLLRDSFKNDKIIPDIVLNRKKEAFSDGISSQRSLYIILQEFIAFQLNLDQSDKKYEATIETEKYYYKTIFDKHFSNCSHILPYYWMPKYTNANDPSARTLDFYSISNV